MNEKYYSKFLILLFALTVIEGFFTLSNLLGLPPSSDKNVVLFGLSWFRLILVALILLLSLFFLLLTVRGLLHHHWSISLSRRIHHYFQQHGFFSSSLMILLPLFFIISFALYLYSNPTIFPGSAIYQYLFVFIRPLLILGLLLSFQGTIIFTIIEWLPASNNSEKKNQNKWHSFIEFTILIISLIIQVILWLYYFSDPRDFINTKIENHFLILTALITLILGNSLTFITNQTRKKRDSQCEYK